MNLLFKLLDIVKAAVDACSHDKVFRDSANSPFELYRRYDLAETCSTQLC